MYERDLVPPAVLLELNFCVVYRHDSVNFFVICQNSWERFARRARGVMMNYYAADERIYIYRLYLQKAQPTGSLWDIVDLVENNEGEVKDVIYLNTIDVSKFVSARDLSDRVKRYYVQYTDDESESEPDDGNDTDDPDPTRSFQ